MKLQTKIMLLTLFLPATGCEVPGVSGNTKTNTQSYSYEYTENGCPTGAHSFNSREEMCDGLRNDSFNNFCAQTLRYQKFQGDCADRTW